MLARYRSLLTASPLCLTLAGALCPPVAQAAVPLTIPIYDSAPAAVQASLDSFQSACAAWPSHPQTLGQRAPVRAPAMSDRDARLLGVCKQVTDPSTVRWLFGSYGAIVAVMVLLVGGFLFGLIRFVTFEIWEGLRHRRTFQTGR